MRLDLEFEGRQPLRFINFTPGAVTEQILRDLRHPQCLSLSMGEGLIIHREGEAPVAFRPPATIADELPTMPGMPPLPVPDISELLVPLNED